MARSDVSNLSGNPQIELTLAHDNFARKGMCSQAVGKTVRGSARVRRDVGPRLDIPLLNSLAVRSLVLLFDQKEKLFSRRLVLTTEGFRQEGISPKRTIIALLGLQRLAESGATQPFDIASMRNAILGDKSWVRNAGDLGLLTWFAAVSAPERVAPLLNEFDLEKALEACSSGHQLSTRSLAWLLAGIAHARLADCGKLPDLTDAAVEIYHVLQENQSEGGLFGCTAELTGFLGRALGKRFGTFSDQIHAIYALSTFGRAFHIEEPLGSALNCANAVCTLQGELGQWWFLYDKRSSRVVNRYPVYSVHQYGTAPAALLALGDVTGQNFSPSICKGLSWVTGANELGADLRNADRTVIWDSIVPTSRVAKCRDVALSFLNIFPPAPAESLRIRFEVRPDHLGWLLYAFGEVGLPEAAIARSAGQS